MRDKDLRMKPLTINETPLPIPQGTFIPVGGGSQKLQNQGSDVLSPETVSETKIPGVLVAASVTKIHNPT